VLRFQQDPNADHLQIKFQHPTQKRKDENGNDTDQLLVGTIEYLKPSARTLELDKPVADRKLVEASTTQFSVKAYRYRIFDPFFMAVGFLQSVLGVIFFINDPSKDQKALLILVILPFCIGVVCWLLGSQRKGRAWEALRYAVENADVLAGGGKKYDKMTPTRGSHVITLFANIVQFAFVGLTIYVLSQRVPDSNSSLFTVLLWAGLLLVPVACLCFTVWIFLHYFVLCTSCCCACSSKNCGCCPQLTEEHYGAHQVSGMCCHGCHSCPLDTCFGTFPHHKTFNQFFTQRQFDAYFTAGTLAYKKYKADVTVPVV